MRFFDREITALPEDSNKSAIFLFILVIFEMLGMDYGGIQEQVSCFEIFYWTFFKRQVSRNVKNHR